jgi:imidazolonepropionase-like amidohydrolase
VTKAHKAARIFDGKSARAIEDGAVIVEEDSIGSVGPATDLSPNTEVIELGEVLGAAVVFPRP